MRDQFDLDPTQIYLNSGTHSITPRRVLDAVSRHQKEYEKNPTQGLIEAYGSLWKVQTRLAHFFGARPQDLFLRANVTQILNAQILGAKLPAKSEIVLTNEEYGAIANLARYRAERDGLKIRTVSRHALETEPASHLRPDTSLVVVSHVYTGAGNVFALETLAAATRARGILLAVDGAHAPGAVELDFSSLHDVDFYGGNLHKWMLGPKGTAFGWINPRSRERIAPIDAGWTTFETGEGFSGFGGGDSFTGAFLMKGCHDFSPFLALQELLNFWDQNGPAQIRAKIGLLQNTMENEMAARGWQTLSPARGSNRGPLLAYELKKDVNPATAMNALYLEYRLQVHLSSWGGSTKLRLSPHVYNTDEELARAAGILTKFLG